MDSSCDTINNRPTYHYEGYGASFSNSHVCVDDPPPLRNGYRHIGGDGRTKPPASDKKMIWSKEECRMLARAMKACKDEERMIKEFTMVFPGRTKREIRMKKQEVTQVKVCKSTKTRKNYDWSRRKSKSKLSKRANAADATMDARPATAEPSSLPSSSSSSSGTDKKTTWRPHKKAKEANENGTSSSGGGGASSSSAACPTNQLTPAL